MIESNMGFSDTAERIDDPAALRDADRTGLLMHASMAGGLVRSISGALDSGALDHLRGARPRALVWITGRSDRPRHAAGVVTALAEATGHPSVPPIVVSRECPGWVGALDIALVSGDDAGDPALAEAIGAAARRGAELVLDLPEEGPARAAAGDRGVWLEALPYVPPQRGLLRHVAAGLAVLDKLGVPGMDVGAAADVLDAEVSTLSPELAQPVNPAKLLAQSVSGSDRVVWVHADATAAAVSARAVAAFAAAGRITASTSLADELTAGADRAATDTGAEPDPVDDIFYDPEIDGERAQAPVRHLGIVCAADPEVVSHAAAALGRVEWLPTPGDPTGLDQGGGQGGRMGADDSGSTPDNAAQNPTQSPAQGSAQDRTGKVLALMARVELAAAYLLVGGL